MVLKRGHPVVELAEGVTVGEVDLDLKLAKGQRLIAVVRQNRAEQVPFVSLDLRDAR